MLVSDMESKVQKCPNVRMGEMDDVSTAFKYGISDNIMNNLWVYDFNLHEESQNNHFSGFPDQESSEFTLSDPGLSSRFFDLQHNVENDDPNSMKMLEETDVNMIKPKEDYETINQTRAKGPRSKRCRRTIFECPWNFKTSTPSVDLYGSIDNQGSAMIKGANLDIPTSKIQKGENLEINDRISESVGVNSVGRWLEDVGFGRYAGMFEMHEVDEEALPLLTIDDLKEMGVLAVGPRRKLYAAICRLRAGCVN